MKNILVMRFSSIGDIVLTSSFITTVKNIYPDSFISMIVKENYKELAKLIPHVERVIPLPKEGIMSRKFIEFIRMLKKEEFDLVVDLHKNLKSFLIYYLLKADKKTRYNKNFIKRIAMVLFSPKQFQPLSVINSYHTALKKIGLNDNIVQVLPKLELNKTIKERVRQLIYSYNCGDNLLTKEKDLPYICIAPFARHRPKEWKLEYFIEVAEYIINKGLGKVILVGEESSVDIRRIHMLNKINNKSINLIGKTSLEELVGIISCCRVVISNDSGPMHIAAALGINSIAIFGPTTPKFGFGFYGEKHIILEVDNLRCRPCSLHGSRHCKYGHYQCLDDIKPQDVILVLKNILFNK